MKRQRLFGIFLMLLMACAMSGCGAEPEDVELEELLALEEPIQQPAAQQAVMQKELPEGTAALELVAIGPNKVGYYMDCLPYDGDLLPLPGGLCRLPLADNVRIFYYPMGIDGSSGESCGSAQEAYSRYQCAEEELQGVLFWTYAFDEEGALCSLSDEIPWELIVQEHPVEDFYGCWDYSDSDWQPGLEMYNIPGEPPCGDYIVLYEDGTAEVYRMEENTVYLAAWEMRDRSAYIEALDILLSFTDAGLEDSHGHFAEQGTAPSTDGMEYVDLT